MLQCNKKSGGKIKSTPDAEAVDANDDFAAISRNDLNFSNFNA
jgi:hypothetical protein